MSEAMLNAIGTMLGILGAAVILWLVWIQTRPRIRPNILHWDGTA